MKYRLWQVVTALVQRLPAGASYAVAFVLGSLAFYGWPRGRRATIRNFSRVLAGQTPGEIRRVSRRSLINYCCYLADFVRFPSLSPRELVDRVGGAESFAALDGVLASGKGAIIVCMHFGNWDLGAGAAAARGYQVTVVAETFADRRLDRMVVESRRRLGMQVVKMERAGPSLIRSVKRNGLLALLIDRPVPGDGVRVTFFGEEVEVPAGPARIAIRTGARVVPAAFPRVRPNRPEVTTQTDFDIVFESSGDEEADVQRLTQAIMASHERFIRANPDQWYMFREMWPSPSRSASAAR